LDTAKAALTGVGFRLLDSSESSMRFEGPGMSSTRQSPLAGASRIRLTAGLRVLTVEAELGGVDRMARFIAFFPAGLCLGLAVLLSGVFSLTQPERTWMLPTLMATLPSALLWLILAPFLTRGIRQRTCKALDTLAQNVSQSSQVP